MSRRTNIMSHKLKEEIAKELGLYDTVKRDGGWQNVSSRDCGNIVTKAIEIANKYEELYAIVGISPNDIEDIKTEEDMSKCINEIEKIASDKKAVAIGEIGLDYYWNKDNKEVQKEMFIKQIKLANNLELPIVIHTREAISDTLEILKENEVNKKVYFIVVH